MKRRNKYLDFLVDEKPGLAGSGLCGSLAFLRGLRSQPVDALRERRNAREERLLIKERINPRAVG